MIKQARIIITRPQAQADTLFNLLLAAGASPQLIPLLHITPAMDIKKLHHALTCLPEVDGAFFISPTAIEQVCVHIRWPNTLPVFVNGPGSAACAKRYGMRNIQLPHTTFDSEGILALPALQHITGKRFILFRGKGGRALLSDTLKQRGAEVELIETYQRLAPQLVATEWQLLRQSDGIIITSSEAAKNLFAQAAENQLDCLQTRQYFVSHPRIGVTLQQLGAHKVTQVHAPDDRMAADVVQFFNKQNGYIA